MVKPANFEIKQSVHGPAAKLAIAGELDMSTTGQLSESLDEQLANGATEVTLDLSQLAFMDSSGLRLLIDLHDRSRNEAWSLRLIAPRREAAALVLRATGADKALPFSEAAEP
jgi:anti-anti-sigma factor